jgi:sorting nexin-1/2
VEHKEVKKEEAKTEEKGEDKEAKDDNKDGKKDEAETEAVKPETPAKAGGEGEGEAGAPAPAAAPQVTVDSSEAPAATESTDSTDPTEPAPEGAAAADKPAPDTHPATIPLPESRVGTPPVFHSDTPRAPGAGASKRASLSAPAPAPDHVSVSPLETPASEATSDYGFRSLAIGASGAPAPSQPLSSSPTSRFGGRGWGAVDAEPLAATAVVAEGDPWNQGGGWGEPRPIPTEQETLQSPEDQSAEAEAEAADDAPPLSATLSIERKRSNSASSPRRSKLLSTPLFQITVSDPTKVGDPVRGHVVYTVRTKTTSPHYRRGDFSVLRRFSDFLWLFEQLSANNPGVIVPPVPDKQPFGRFQDQFIETRRTALQRCLAKMTAHPILQLDPDLRLFLESDSFALDVKNRRMAPVDGAATPSSGFMSSWTGPRYVEHDEWFDQRKTYLDHLEGQLKGMSKALDAASKARLEMAMSVGEFADAAQVLADSDLGAAMCAALARLADLGRKERTAGEDQAKADVAQLLNLADEYIRFIASVRLAFASRVRAYHVAQTAEKDVMRIRKQREKDRQAGRLGDRAASSMAEVQEVSSVRVRVRASA